MKTKQKYLKVEGYRVDISAVTKLKYRCDPQLCRNRRCCCSVYDVWINAKEKKKISSYFPAVSNDYPIENMGAKGAEYLHWIGAGYIIRKDKEQVCSLSYRTNDGQILCSLHSLASDQNLPLKTTKPASCVLWPLCLSGKESKTLSVQENAYDFPCCSIDPNDNYFAIESGTASLIKENFGEFFFSILEQKLQALAAKGKDVC